MASYTILNQRNYLTIFSPTGSGLLEFGEFCQLAARFLVEEDEEALKKELKEAFRIYDKQGQTGASAVLGDEVCSSAQKPQVFRCCHLFSVAATVR